MDLASLSTREREELAPPGVFGRHDGITETMRATLARWLLEVNVYLKEDGAPEAVQTAMALTDLYFSRKSVTRGTIQLVGCTAMMIACKLYGMGTYELSDAVHHCDGAYAKDAFKDMEWEMLGMHDFAAQLVIPLHFYYLDVPSTPVADAVARMLMDVGAALIPTGEERHLPSKICDAAVNVGALVADTGRIDMHGDFTDLEIQMMAAMEKMRYGDKGNGIKKNHPVAFDHFFVWYCDPEVSAKRKRHA